VSRRHRRHPELMEALRKRTFGNETPVFDAGRFQGLIPKE
jgi:hypothetical protein